MIKPKKCLENISPYEIDFYKQDWRLKLDANENIYGCANNIISAIKNIPNDDIYLYPAYGELIDRVSEKYKVNKTNILFTNGCDEALSVLINTYLEENEEILSYYPTFSMPGLYAKVTGAKTRYIEYDEKFIFNINKFRQNIIDNTKLVYIATPNNPTGEVARASLIETLIKEFPNVLFVIDCTYINFSLCAMFEDYIDLTKKYDNVAVVKSYSKDFGIAGLRFGLVIADESVINNLKKVISPYSVNMIAINCAHMILSDEKRIEEIKELNNNARNLLSKILLEANYKPYPSEANFILCDFGLNCEFYYKKLRNNGIITRKYSKDSILENCLRITIPTLGGVKFIAELLVKKETLVFDFDVICELEKLLLSKDVIEILSKTYDFAIICDISKKDVEEILNQNEILKYFHCIIASDEIEKIAEYVACSKIRYFSSNVNNIILLNKMNIDTIGVINEKQDSQNATNNYRHIGVDFILNDIKNIDMYIKDSKLCLE